MDAAGKLQADQVQQLRKLAHDLSNALETILQASYLLGKAELEPNARKWTEMIDQASQEAARLSREIREILRSQTQPRS